MATKVHKTNSRAAAPLVSIVLLDWECRERFHTLDWLARQDAPRDQYEIIWVELYHRVVPDVMAKADVVITCGQEGLYHKHKGYNIGLLCARGAITVVSDSDAVYPPDFISSIISTFQCRNGREPMPLVLMYHEWRTNDLYPDDLTEIGQLRRHQWRDLIPNVGACVCLRTADAFRFGGFDEHRSYRGYLCGPYDLSWRLVNAGLPEIWHDETTVALWHFAHPEPLSVEQGAFSLKRWSEVVRPHVDYHSLAAVEGFSSGRLLPRQENAEIHHRRMALRRIGTKFEEKYARMSGVAGFSRWKWCCMYASLLREVVVRIFRHNPASRWLRSRVLGPMRRRLAPRAIIAWARPRVRKLLGDQAYCRLRDRWYALLGRQPPGAGVQRTDDALMEDSDVSGHRPQPTTVAH